MKKYKCLNIFSIILFSKILLLLFIGYQIKYEKKEVKKIHKTRNLISIFNITNYNMIRFVDYENLEFNSVNIFKYFRKKFFNISRISFDYDGNSNKSKIEFTLGIYEEDKNLIKPKNNSKNTKYKCFQKSKNTFLQKTPLIIDNKYFKCIETFNFSETTKFGMIMNRKKVNFRFYFDFSDIFNLYLLNISNKI